MDKISPEKPEDIALLKLMKNCRIDGCTLPSGLKIPIAPDGMAWIADRGEIHLGSLREWEEGCRARRWNGRTT